MVLLNSYVSPSNNRYVNALVATVVYALVTNEYTYKKILAQPFVKGKQSTVFLVTAALFGLLYLLLSMPTSQQELGVV